MIIVVVRIFILLFLLLILLLLNGLDSGDDGHNSANCNTDPINDGHSNFFNNGGVNKDYN